MRDGPHPASENTGFPPAKIVGIGFVASCLLLMIYLYAAFPEGSLENPMLLAWLNTVFLSVLPLAMSWLAAKSYQSSGAVGFLLMGCGLVFFGTSSFYAGWVMPLAKGPNPTVTLHNIGALLAGTCEATGAFLFLGETIGLRKSSPQKTRYKTIYVAIIALISLIAFLSFRGLLPLFFDATTGPTHFRQIVLTSAIVAFVLAGGVFMGIYMIARTGFAFWFGLSLGLITIGLTGVLVQPSVGSLIGWAGRAAQYAGGFLLVIAFLGGKWEMTGIDRSSKLTASWTLWPYLESAVKEKTSKLTELAKSLEKEIADRKQMEEKLRESERFLATVIEQSPSSLWISDAKGALIMLNQACRKVMRISDEEVIGKYNILKDNIIRDSGYLPLVEKVFAKGQPARFTLSYDTSELQGLDLSQSARVVLDVGIAPILDTFGNVTNAVIQHIDISEITQARTRIDQLVQELRITLENATVGICRIQDRKIAWANPAMDDIFRYQPGALVGIPTTLLYPDQASWKSFGAEVYPLLAMGQIHSSERLMRRKDGTTFWCSLRGQSIPGDQANFGSIWIVSDITERKRSALELEQALARNQELLGELQHRVKNSFNMITSLAILTADTTENPATQTALREFEARVRSISQLYSLLYANGSFDQVRLDLYCSQVISAMSAFAPGVKIGMAMDELSTEPRIATPIAMIVTELLTNALKYAFPTGQPGKVTVSLANGEGSSRMEIRDDGVGIPADFDLSRNAGMGLQLVQAMVGQIGGTLVFERLEPGTAAIVTFPVPVGLSLPPSTPDRPGSAPTENY